MTTEEEPPRFVINDEDGMDETDVNLRGYLSSLPAEKLATYDPNFTDEELMAWEENFRDDGHLLLVCCTRDVDLDEYRAAIEEILASRA
ncbi:hypothetical protein K2Y11_04890 [bacterium]|nr:hypothetical protein [bacterium]